VINGLVFTVQRDGSSGRIIGTSVGVSLFKVSMRH